MNHLSQESTLQEVSTEICDKEPIHIPNQIQSHGVLMVVQEPELNIVQVSGNTLELLGIPAEEILFSPLGKFLSKEDLEYVTANINTTAFHMINPLRIALNGRSHDWILHRHQEMLFLEMEPIINEHENVVALYGKLSLEAVAAIKSVHTLEELTQVATSKIQELTGFDRVMLYRFDESYNGQVIAEAVNPGIDSFLNLFFPASDIPPQARALYTKNFCRYIPNVNYEPVRVEPITNPVTREYLDMSYSLLRGVSPFHIEYLKNMGVSASMSFSIVIDEKLWGLFACHHYTPRYISYIHRLVCEQTAAMFISELSTHVSIQHYEARLEQSCQQVLQHWHHGRIEALVPSLLDMTASEGAAVCQQGEITCFGTTPSKMQIEQLAGWLDLHFQTSDKQLADRVLATSNLSRIFRQSTTMKTYASGLIAVPLSEKPGHYMLWFRPEVIVRATWGGNPDKALSKEAMRVSPRSSFEAWKKDVVNTAAAWHPAEIRMATRFRDAVYNKS